MGLANTAALPATNPTTGSVTAGPPFGALAASVSAGFLHTCGVTTDGTLACWGDNRNGQASPPSGTFTAPGAGAAHTARVRTNGALACWGDTGAGRTIPKTGPLTPAGPGA